jgi:hypothetical protein
MEEPPCSSSERSSTKGKLSIDQIIGINLLNDDLLHNIFTRLPALSFASASCVNKSWKSVCNRIISRPKLSSALSLNPSLLVSPLLWSSILLISFFRFSDQTNLPSIILNLCLCVLKISQNLHIGLLLFDYMIFIGTGRCERGC